MGRTAPLWPLLLITLAATADAPGDVEQARAAAAALGSELQTRLLAALKEGPESAVSVCADEAQAIAARVSLDTGFGVGRTALKTRNPANAPQPWQRPVLADWSERVAAGESLNGVEFYDTTADGFRYMRPIVTQGLCVTCHGGALAPALADAIAERYPHDQATGFEPGSLRGAFVVTGPPN